MPDIDSFLYKWICKANTKLEDLDLPVGITEDSVALLKQKLGDSYLQQMLIADSSPIPVFDDESRGQFRKWLLSARSDEHVIQVLELAAYLKTFQKDPSLQDKIEKLKFDTFWPVFFELAIATRIKRACLGDQQVALNSEVSLSTGDFTIKTAGLEIPCECSRLGKSPQISEPKVLSESICHVIQSKTRRIAFPVCIKISSVGALTGHTYNGVLQLIRRAMRDARNGNLPVHISDGETDVSVEILTSASESVQESNLKNNWTSGVRLYSVPARNWQEVSDRFDQGERFHEHESLRLFMKFATPVEQADSYSRLIKKIRKKLTQTKISDKHMGKIVLIEVPFNFRTIDRAKVQSAIDEVVNHSRSTLAVILASREPNPQRRYHFSQIASFNEAALRSGKTEIQELIDLLNRSFLFELHLDPITGEPYRRSWSEALARRAVQRED